MDILEKLGVKFDDLSGEERKTIMSWYKAVESRRISLPDVRDYVTRMRVDVDNQLASDKLTKKQDLYLKARLKNYILLESFLTSPEQAKKALDLYISSRIGGE